MTFVIFLGIAGVIVVAASWNGTIVGSGPGPVGGGGGVGSESPLDPDRVTVPRTSFGLVAAQASVRNVKNRPRDCRRQRPTSTW
jgi:hypothetical protein